jgi:hypothetical protein
MYGVGQGVLDPRRVREIGAEMLLCYQIIISGRYRDQSETVEDWEGLMGLLISIRNWETLFLEQQMLPCRFDVWASKLLSLLVVYIHILPLQQYRDGNDVIERLPPQWWDNFWGKDVVVVLSLTREYLREYEMCVFDLRNQVVMVE